MDSLTQMALGAAVGTAVLGHKVGPRAALWGAAVGTLPDLDVLVPYGDPVRDFTFHRAESHSLFWLSLAAPALAWPLARWQRVRDAARGGAHGVGYRDWLLLVWLALVTHPLLDAFTVYGTQLLLPFSDYPVGLGSVFIIDPLYTLPLLGLLVATLLGLRRAQEPGQARRAQRWNTLGLVVSTLYLAWTVAAQAHVRGEVHRSLATTPLHGGKVLVTPTPFNSLLWRVVVMDHDAYHEGVHSVLDRGEQVALSRHPTANAMVSGLADAWAVRRLAWFTKGFYALTEGAPALEVSRRSAGSLRQLLGAVDTAYAAELRPAVQMPVVMTDLRMGQTPWFVFAFIVAERAAGELRAVPVRQVPTVRPPRSALPLLWRRIWNEDVPLPAGQSSTLPP